MELYEKRKKLIYDFIYDEHYVPMKIKELAIMLEVKKEDRPILEQILLELQQEGKIMICQADSENMKIIYLH